MNGNRIVSTGNRIISILAGIVFLASGCFSNPTKQNKKAEERVEKTKGQIQATTDKKTDAARSYILGADYSLKLDPNPTRYSLVAEGFTERSLSTLGGPSLEESLKIKELVRGLLSTNSVELKKAEAELKKRDADVISLEHKVDDLQSKLDKAEEKFKKVAEENAGYASKWIAIKKIVYWIAGIIGFGFILHIASVLVPPPYNAPLSIVSMFLGAIGGLVKKAAPASLHYMGAVGKDVYDKSEDTLKSLVASIEEIRKKKPDVFETHFEPVLKDKLDQEEKYKVIEVKKEIGAI